MNRTPRILIIDDDPDLVQALKIILETGSYRVISASDGEEGLRKVKEENPDLVILDLLLPKVDGDVLCRELKADSQYVHIPILILTALAEKANLKLFPTGKAGPLLADDYVDKPVQPEDLLDRVKRLLARSKGGGRSMIITKQKPFEQILRFLESSPRVFIAGCSECATTCKTGGEEEAKEMERKLRDEGKVVSGWAVLALACGNGVQAVSESIDKEVYPGCDTLFLGEIIRFGNFEERCQLCGECILDRTGGICPVTRCSKSLFNGPCGGAEDGKCEIDPEIECGWQLIIDRLGKQGKLHLLEEIIPPKDWSKSRDGGLRKLTLGRKQK